VRVDEHTIQMAGSPVFYRTAPALDVPPLYLHGVPTSSDDWVELLAVTGGIAPDLPGFGRTGKAGHLDYTLEGHARFVEELLATLEITQVELVLHDWGAAPGLVFAQRHPERVKRIVLVNAVGLVEGFRWHRLARLWRLPVAGELAMGTVNSWLLGRALRQASSRPESWPPERVQAIWRQFDQGTQRAIIRLHRSADESALAAAGAGLSGLNLPALVLWGERDPWLPASIGEAYARALPGAQLVLLPDAGHWPWLDQPAAGERIAEFLTGQA
jgi:pimeloyl-ACP methyl ester carboxylesterase